MSTVDYTFPPAITNKRNITECDSTQTNDCVKSPPKKRRKTNMTLHSKLVEEFARRSHIRNSVNLSSYHAKKQNIKTLCPYHDMCPVLNTMKTEVFKNNSKTKHPNCISITNSINIQCKWSCSASPYKTDCRTILSKAKELYEYEFNLNDIALPFMNGVVLGGPTPNICINVTDHKHKNTENTDNINNHTITNDKDTVSLTFEPLQNLSLLQRNTTHNIAVKAISCGTFKRNLQPVPGPCRITKLLDGDACFIPIQNSQDIFLKIWSSVVKQRRKLQGTDSVLGVGFDCASTTNWNKPRVYWMHQSVYNIKDKKKIIEKKHIANRDLRFSLLIPHGFSGDIHVFMIGISHKKVYTINTNHQACGPCALNTNQNVTSNYSNINIDTAALLDETTNNQNTNSMKTQPNQSINDVNGTMDPDNNMNNNNMIVPTLDSKPNINITDNVAVMPIATAPMETMISQPQILNNNNNNNIYTKIDEIKCIEYDLENGNKNAIDLLHLVDFRLENTQTLASKWIRICIEKYNNRNNDSNNSFHLYLLNIITSLISTLGVDKTVRGLKRVWMDYNSIENEWSFLHMICSKNLLYLFQSILNLFVSMNIKHEILLSTTHIHKNSKLKISPVMLCVMNNNYQFTKYLFDYFLNNLQSNEILSILNQNTSNNSLINDLMSYNHTQTLQQLINVNSCKINQFLTVQQIQLMLNVINNNQTQQQQQQYLINCYKYQ